VINALFLGIGALAIAIGAWRWLRARHTAGRRGVAITLTALGVALVCLADASQSLESQVWPGLGRLLSNAATLVAAYGITIAVNELADETRRPHRRLRQHLLAIALIILAISFFTGPRIHGTLGLLQYQHHPGLVIYDLTYIIYLGAAVIDIAIVTARTVAISRGWLRTGLALVLGACALAAAYIVGKIISVANALVGTPQPETPCAGPFSAPSCALSVGFPAMSIFLLILGVTSLAAGPRLSRRISNGRDRRRLRAVRPLHDALTVALPQIVRVDARSADVRHQLVTTAVEIRDGLLLLGLPQPERAAPDDIAHDIHTALTQPDLSADIGRHTVRTAQPTDLDAEIAWLQLITQAYQAVNVDRINQAGS
jgi:hypothetical protein